MPKQTIDLGKLTQELMDRGKIIEAGWLGYATLVLPHDAPDIQVSECKLAFYAGASHLFSSLMTALEPGEAPTDTDLSRMDNIQNELEEFSASFEKQYGKVQSH